jgi:DNA-binding SARP family transcriptional activator
VADGEDVGLGPREERLTALLGLTGQSSRMHVAGILWPESADTQALDSLRSAVLATHRHCPGLLQANRRHIGLRTAVEVDVDKVRRAAAATEHLITEGEAAALMRQLVGEELLPDWYDDWVLPERESLERLRAKALERIARQALEAGDLQRCVDAARAASDIDPLRESASELAIRAHLGRGDLGMALLQFGRYRDAMREELGVSPTRTILELIEPALTESGVAMVSRRGEVLEVAAVPPPATAAPAGRRTVAIPGRPRKPVVSTRGRGVAVRLLGVAVLILAAALAAAGVGTPRDGGDTGASGDAGASAAPVHPLTRVLPADSAIRSVQMVVRLVDAAAGRAAFLVRTTAQPTLVRFEVSGDEGRSIVRSVLVRSPDGRRLELSGLRPGIYQWLATSSVASAVSGRLRIPDPPVTVDADDTIEAVEAPPTAAPTTEPTTAPIADAAPPPPSSNDTPQSHPTSRPNPTGPPKDPGTKPLSPVG